MIDEQAIRERLEAITYGKAEADHDFTMQLRELAREKGERYSGPLLDRALLVELNDDRAEAKPAEYAREFLEILGPPEEWNAEVAA